MPIAPIHNGASQPKNLNYVFLEKSLDPLALHRI